DLDDFAPNAAASETSVAEQRSIIPPEEPVLALSPDSAPVSSLEQRVRRLEDAMKEIQETRVTDRPAEPAPSPTVLPPESVLAAPNVALDPAVVAPMAQVLPSEPEGKQPWLFPEIVAEARAI